MLNDGELLIHNLIDSIQKSIDIADKTSRKKYNFALSKMTVKMTLSFNIKEDDSKSKTKSDKPNHYISLFSHKNNSQKINSTAGDVEDSKGSVTIQMLFKPGGKAFDILSDQNVSDQDDFDSTDTSNDSSSGSSDSDSDSDDEF
jgi:hypothetical protein